MSELKLTTIEMGLMRLAEVCDVKINPLHPEITFETWHMALADLSDEQVQAGFVHLIKTLTSEYNPKPKPGDIRAFANQSSEQVFSWAEAWQEVLDKAHLFYSPVMGMAPPQWSTPAIEQAVQQFGGITTIVNMLEKDIPTHRAQFRGIFEQVSKRAEQKATMTLLTNAQRPDFKVLEGGR